MSEKPAVTTTEKGCDELDKPNKAPRAGVRHLMIVLMHTFLVCTFLTRSTLSLAIVAMTDPSASSNPNIPTYDWQNTGAILSSFFWSYVVFQPFSGYIFIRFSFKWVLLATMLINVIAFMLIPLSVYNYGSTGLIVCRVVQGLFQGFCYPAIHHALGLWVPRDERSLLSMIARAGNKTGSIIAMLTTGYVSASYWGWPAVFYVLGTVSLIWCAFWAVLASNSPDSHRFISEIERDYIEHSLETKEKQDIWAVPFKAILTSLPFWAIAVANAGISWGYTLTDAAVPTYLGKGLGLDISTNGITAALTNVVQILVNTPLAIFGDYLVVNNHLSLLTWRRLTQGIGSYVPSLALVWLAFITKDQVILGIALLYIYSGIDAILIFGSLVNHVDLSPRYAGVLMSIENTIAQIIAICAPFLLDVITDQTNLVMWRWIFLSLAIVMTLTATFFIVFVKTEIQWWNSKNRRDSVEPKKISNATET